MVDDNLRKQLTFEANRKSVGVAYLLWLLLGWAGVHRFYAGSTGTGIAQLLLSISIIGWLVLLPWLVADLFLIPGLIRDRNMETLEMMGGTAQRQPPAPREESKPEPEREQAPQPLADPRREQMLEELRTIGYRKDRRRDFSR